MGVFGSIAGAVGSAAWSVAKGAGKIGWAGTKLAGKAALKGMDYAAKGAFKVGVKAAKGAAYIAKDAYNARNARDARNMIGVEIHTVGAMAKGMGDWQRSKDVYNKATGELTHHDGRFKLGKFGVAAFGVPAVVSAAVDGSQQYMQERVGANDGQVVTATPVVAAKKYSTDNCGATGDLVFALHNNRHG
jgi:hypothetical protein